MGIHHVGVELEGAWKNRPDNFTYDGSVGGFPYGEYPHIGEVPTPGDGLPVSEINAWMETNYPDAVNQTCGMHVHISVETKAEYSLLMSHAAKLEKDLIQNVSDWAKGREIIERHPLWARLRGENSFCRPGTTGVDAQVRARHKVSSRYRMLNFCWRLHGTLEVRLLPGFKMKNLGIEAVNMVISTVHTALRTYEGLPKEFTRPTSVGTIECHAWKQGFTCFLDTSTALKQEIYTKLYGRQKSQSMLARLLKRDRVTIPVITHDALDEQLTNAALTLNRFKVTLEYNLDREESN